MKSCSKDKSSKYIMYLDANNLYGWALTQYLRAGRFQCLIQDEVEELDLNLICRDNPDSFVLEVDLEYPEELHNLHNDYLFAPEKIEIKESMLSDYF